MPAVGIIANPASGKDIRRLVAHGAVCDNNAKVGLLRRIMAGLVAVGAGEVVAMPDAGDLARRAAAELGLACRLELLAMTPSDSAHDSTRAAGLLDRRGVACLIVLGGDGTCRAVAKASGDTPLLAVSTGTNNVFPTALEGTLAGLAAGLVATGAAGPASWRAPKLEIIDHGRVIDMALVDVAVTAHCQTGCKALWRPESLRRLFLTRAEPTAIGLSAIGGCLSPLAADSGQGLELGFGPGGRTVLATMAPGLVARLAVSGWRRFAPGQELAIDGPATLALDGEREIIINPGQRLGLRLCLAGPWVLDGAKILETAAREGAFMALAARRADQDISPRF